MTENHRIMNKAFSLSWLQHLLIMLLIGGATQAYAISISAYRIYMDDDNRTTSFMVMNREVEPQECELKLRHYNFDVDSNLLQVSDDVLPENSAQEWVRFSPKKFTLTPAHTQTIRFTMRRRADATDGEYRSYLEVDCGAEVKISENEAPILSIKPKLMHNIPIIVRVGTLDAQVSIDNVKVDGDGLAFTIYRNGSRSVYGDVELINKNTESKVSYQSGVSIYPESSRYHFVLGREGVAASDLRVRFVENKNYGGSITVEKDATAGR